MATGVITNTTRNPSDVVVANVPVVARLRPAPGFRISDSTEITQIVETTSNSVGFWSLALEQTSNITPANSWWEIEEQFTPANGSPRAYAVSVGAGTNSLLSSLTTPLPVNPEQYITQASADARYVRLPVGTSGLGTSVLEAPYSADRTGTNDATTAINSAISAVSLAGGGDVWVPSGIYSIDPAVGISLLAGVRLRLQGKLKVATNSLADYSIVKIYDADNAAIIGPGTIEGDRATHGGSLLVEGGKGIDVRGSDNVLIYGLLVKECFGDGLYTKGNLANGEPRDLRVLDCTFDGNRRNGVAITGCIGGSIRGCVFKNTGGATAQLGVAPMTGIDLEPTSPYDVTDVQVVGCIAHDNAGDGMTIYGGTTHSAFVACSSFSNTGTAGADYGKGFRIGNASFCRITGCDAYSNGTDGISVDGTGAVAHTAKYNTVSGCTSRANGAWGIDLDTAASQNVRNNVVTGCTVEGNTSGGIRIQASSVLEAYDNTVTGCSVKGNTGVGIQLTHCRYNSVTGNTVAENDSDGIQVVGDNALHNTIGQNTVRKNGVHGINLTTASTYTSCVGNDVFENDEHGIRLNSSNDNTVVGNTCTANGQAADNTYDNIVLITADRNNVQTNTCRLGGSTNDPRYGLNVSNAGSDNNLVTNNDLKDSGQTGAFNNSGTGTVTTAGNRT